MTCANCGDDPCLKYIGCPGVPPQKPFARVDRELGVLMIGGQATEELVGGDWAEFEETAERINAAVEQREVNLRGALIEAIDGLGAAACVIDPVAHQTTYAEVIDAQTAVRSAIEDRYDAISGDVACGLAFDYGALDARLRAPFMVLLDRMLGLGEIPDGKTLARLFVEYGLGEMKNPAFLASDEELIHEMSQRGLVDRPLVLPVGLANVPSELRPGEVFGATFDGMCAYRHALGGRCNRDAEPRTSRCLEHRLVPSLAGRRPGDSPGNPLPVRVGPDGHLTRQYNERYITPVPASARLEWHDDTGAWHELDGDEVPAEAREVLAVYDGSAAGFIIASSPRP